MSETENASANAGGAQTEDRRMGGGGELGEWGERRHASAANMFLPHGYSRPAQL